MRDLPSMHVNDPEQLNRLCDRLESLPIIVPPTKLDETFGTRGRVIVNITCRRTGLLN